MAACAIVIALCLSAAPLAQTAPLKLLAFGDSLTAGYGLPRADGFEAQLGDALRKNGFDVTILDGGVSGDTSAGGKARIDWALADKPDAAVVELGGNDGLRGLPPSEMQANLTFILDRLQQAGVKTLLSGMYPPPNLGADYTQAFHAVFDRLGSLPLVEQLLRGVGH
jgi:acyl-CoA thioesterase-1